VVVARIDRRAGRRRPRLGRRRGLTGAFGSEGLDDDLGVIDDIVVNELLEILLLLGTERLTEGGRQREGRKEKGPQNEGAEEREIIKMPRKRSAETGRFSSSRGAGGYSPRRRGLLGFLRSSLFVYGGVVPQAVLPPPPLTPVARLM